MLLLKIIIHDLHSLTVCPAKEQTINMQINRRLMPI